MDSLLFWQEEPKKTGLHGAGTQVETMVLNQLGIYGWKEQDENLVMASLLTGHALLMIGNRGCVTTDMANTAYS